MAAARPRLFADLLRRTRRASGLSQEELADRAGLSRSGISELERGLKLAPHKDTIVRLADALELVGAERRDFEAAARARGAAYSSSQYAHPARFPAAVSVVGREYELVHLERVLARVGPPVLVLAGEPGIGKSRLLREAAERGRATGWAVLEDGCTRRAGQEAFAPLVGALAHHVAREQMAQLRADLQGCTWLVRLLPELAERALMPLPDWAPPVQERRLMFAAAARYMANIGGPAGTLLVIDDLQWAGSDALDLLESLVRVAGEDGERALRIVGAYRNTEVRPQDPLAVLLTDLAREGLAQHVEVGPLTPSNATVLVERVLGSSRNGTDEPVPADARERLLKHAGGIPFFLVSGARALAAGALDVPWDVRQSIHQRVSALPAPAQALLGAASVAGRVVPVVLLLALSEQPEREALDALQAISRARLLVEAKEDGAYYFAHDLVREVVEAGLGSGQRTMWHRRIAEALERGPAESPVERLAYHYARAGNQEKAVVYLEQAGDRAWALHANTEAADRYRELVLALDTLGATLDAARAREKLGDVLIVLAHYDEALAVLEQALSARRADGDVEGATAALARIACCYAQ